MLNTNESGGGTSAVAELHTYLEQTLFTRAGLTEVLLASSARSRPSAAHLRRVEVRAASIEIGPLQHRVHAHWVMKIVHSDLRLNIGRMQGALQKHLAAHTSFHSPFASVTLLNAAPENYALKEVYDDVDDCSDSDDAIDAATVDPFE